MTQYSPIIISDGQPVDTPVITASGREKTLAYSILTAHNKSSKPGRLSISFDALISHDITYVGIIQTARASGLDHFPIPYALTNCHNSLCAVGGTINQDDHAFGLSAAVKYGGIYVPANQAVIHQYAREKMAKCKGMILGSDSHTRYGCYGCLGVGEGGGELVKQLLQNTWDVDSPEVILVWLEGAPRRGIGPHDVALSLAAETFPEGRVKNKVLEFAGPGVKNLSMDFRTGIDVMTTETSCLTSVWETDDTVKAFYSMVGREHDYSELKIPDGACYDGIVRIDLSKVESMIALPFHPSKAYPIHALQQDAFGLLTEVEMDAKRLFGSQIEPKLTDCIKNGVITADQGVIVGCAGGMYENIAEAAAILENGSGGSSCFDLSVYPCSAPVSLAAVKDGTSAKLMEAGAVIKPSFCGPCFGAGDTPANNSLSLRHATRNFPNREGSKPGNGQISFVALMDARSIAATAKNGGVLTAATDIEYTVPEFNYTYSDTVYEKCVYNGFGKAQPNFELKFGPNITDWPEIRSLDTNLLMRLCAVIHDDVTTTDELIPSGETSSYRSNPLGLSEFTLSRRCPSYVSKSKAVRDMDAERINGRFPEDAGDVLGLFGASFKDTAIGSCIFAEKPGDGSAREQAASCQKVLGGCANICYEYATKRYRSNCINWGILPFTIPAGTAFEYGEDDWIYIPGIRQALENGGNSITAYAVTSDGKQSELMLDLGTLDSQEREILLDGCLMNYYAHKTQKQKAGRIFK